MLEPARPKPHHGRHAASNAGSATLGPTFDASPTPDETPGSSISPPPTPTAVPGTPTPVRSLSPDTGLARDSCATSSRLRSMQQQLSGRHPRPGRGGDHARRQHLVERQWPGADRSGRGATGDTPFVIGSITKTFIAAAVMQLADEGRLAIDDPLSNWLPDYPNAGQITLRELLHHTSGIYNYFEYPTYDTLVFQTLVGHVWTPQEILDTLVNGPISRPAPATTTATRTSSCSAWSSSRRPGSSSATCLTSASSPRSVCAPPTSRATARPAPIPRVGYLLKPIGFKAVTDGTDYRPTISAATVAWSAGGIVSSARDIAAWCDALYGGHVVSPAALAQMEDFIYYPKPDETYGLGTRSRVIGGERVFGHTGSIRGFDAAAWHFPDTNMTIVVMTNLGRIDANPIVDALAAVALPVAQGYLP